ncbi:MAG: purine-nucleoside phosphorylase [Candidatus Marinimicrobia bacterium]|nr:purine-nucleoside phosphorylase [Candidatus Neomarinimicrobiota bacterium]
MKKHRHVYEFFRNDHPSLGIILGSGLNDLLDSVDIWKKLPYSDIPDFPRSTVEGHEGAFISGSIDHIPVLAAKGRFHYYEGYDLGQVLSIVRSFHELGIQHVVVTNAAGLIDPGHQPGDILLIRDCIDMTGQVKEFDPGLARLRKAEETPAKHAAKEAGIALGEGVYVWTTGPSYETPAEIEYFRSRGGDLVGMSTMPEIMWARRNGMKVYPFSCATNWASGMAPKPLTHEEVYETARRVQKDLTRYILTLCRHIGG